MDGTFYPASPDWQDGVRYVIGIEGQWVLLIDIGDVQDAIRPEDLDMLQLTEMSGLGLPTFILKFATQDETVTPYLNEVADIKISFGRTSSDLHSCNVYATEINVTKEGDTRRHVEMQGLLNYPDYLSSNVVGITDKMSAVEALTNLAKRQGFTMDPDNITTSEDKQYWIQPNIPDKRFATHLWLHAKLTDSFPISSVSVVDETFRIFDAKKRISTTPKWEFTYDMSGGGGGGGGTKIGYNGNYTMRNATGFVNAWVGYKREYLQYDAQTGETKTLDFEIKPMLSMTSQMPTVGVEARFGDIVMWPNDVDPDFNLTFHRNLAYLAQFSCFGTELQFQNAFHLIQVCDLCYFKDDSTEKPKVTASEYASGLFFVSRVNHLFTSRRYTCTAKISREAPGDVA